ncbi:Gfo/Idh/MocA family protein [Flavitalea sp.]|nr:Gfo/Idh/MocA family oxidoreductase [Flavitalea sp.]
MKIFKWGIIGPGSIARDFVDDFKFVSTPQEVTSVLSHSEDSAKTFADEYGVSQYYTDLELFLNNKNFDAVYIASPNTSHFEQAIACLNHKVPVLCEKPMVINSAQVTALMAASESNNTFLMEGMWIRFLPSIKKVLEIIGSGEIGEIDSVKASLSFKAPEDDNNRYFNPELGGGSLLDLGIYPVFLAHLVLGKPRLIKAVGKLSDKGIDETCAILFQYEDGKHAVLESSIITQTELSAEIAGSKGVIKILSPWNEKPAAIKVSSYDGVEKEYKCEWEGRGFQFEVEEVISALNNNQIYSKLYYHHFSLDIMKTIDEVRKQIDVKYESFE